MKDFKEVDIEIWKVKNHSPSIQMDCDISEVIDYYVYHDAPSSVSFWLSIDNVRALIARLQEIEKEYMRLENEDAQE